MLSQLGDRLSYPCFGWDKVSSLTSRAALYLTVTSHHCSGHQAFRKHLSMTISFWNPCGMERHTGWMIDPVGFSVSLCLCDKTGFQSQVSQLPAGLEPLVGRRCDPTMTVLLQNLGDPWPFWGLIQISVCFSESVRTASYCIKPLSLLSLTYVCTGKQAAFPQDDFLTSVLSPMRHPTIKSLEDLQIVFISIKSSGNTTGSDWEEKTRCKHRGEGIKPLARTWGISCVQFGWCKDRTILVPKAFTLIHTELASAGRHWKGKHCPLTTEKQFLLPKWCWIPQGSSFWAAPSSTKVLSANSPPPPFPTNFSRSFQTTTEMLKLQNKTLPLIQRFLC